MAMCQVLKTETFHTGKQLEKNTPDVNNILISLMFSLTLETFSYCAFAIF